MNGIRAAIRKGLFDWLKDADPDVFLLQETKAKPEQVDISGFEKLGYSCHFHSAEKAGYSGVAIFTKQVPDKVEIGCGIEKYDREGRILRIDIADLTILSTYFPSGSSGELRQAFKMEFLEDFRRFAKKLKNERPNLVISGDYNICHRAIDIHNPITNKKSSGFLPEEREWVSQFIELGFIDSFRLINGDVLGKYSWWTYRFNARKKNLGWRIDYHMVSQPLHNSIVKADILQDVHHSDHCPISLELKLND